MKPFRTTMGVILALGLLALPAGGTILAGKGFSDGFWDKLADLRKAQAQIALKQDEADKTNEILESNIVAEMDRQFLSARVGMDLEQISAFQTDETNDLAYFQDHWTSLTPSEKELVKEGRMNMDE